MKVGTNYTKMTNETNSAMKLYNSAVDYYKERNYCQAIDDLNEAIIIFKKEKLMEKVVTCYSTLFSCFRDSNDHDQAIKSSEEIFKICKIYNIIEPKNFTEKFNLFIKEVYDINLKSILTGNTRLHDACKGPMINIDRILYLVNSGIDLIATNHNGLLAVDLIEDIEKNKKIKGIMTAVTESYRVFHEAKTKLGELIHIIDNNRFKNAYDTVFNNSNDRLKKDIDSYTEQYNQIIKDLPSKVNKEFATFLQSKKIPNVTLNDLLSSYKSVFYGFAYVAALIDESNKIKTIINCCGVLSEIMNAKLLSLTNERLHHNQPPINLVCSFTLAHKYQPSMGHATTFIGGWGPSEGDIDGILLDLMYDRFYVSLRKESEVNDNALRIQTGGDDLLFKSLDSFTRKNHSMHLGQIILFSSTTTRNWNYLNEFLDGKKDDKNYKSLCSFVEYANSKITSYKDTIEEGLDGLFKKDVILISQKKILF